MENPTIHSVFFSTAYSTRKVIREIAGNLGFRNIEHDITGNTPLEDIKTNTNDLLVVGVPVFSGRVPQLAIDGLEHIKGNNTPAIIVCVYGNRDYDDALIELRDIVIRRGCTPIAAAAVIARHSIFREIAAGRPDKEDFFKINAFCNKVKSIIESLDLSDAIPTLPVKGNEPYRQIKKIPIHPTADRRCNKCGSCARLCPVQAIPQDSPDKTDKNKCISCGRCIAICPQKARNFRGILFKLASWKFKKNNSARKEPDFFYIER